jgi:RNA 2',3'-cyclic 3'-phosphodiesterase
MRSSLSAMPGRAPRHALFFALYPPVETAARISRFADRMFEKGLLRGPRVACERLHISLNGLGTYQAPPNDLVGRASEAASKVKRRRFKLALNRLMSFQNKRGPHPCVLSGDDGLIGIDLLYGAIYLTLRLEGLRCPRERITPHLTLSRETTALPDDFIEPVSWQVDEFRLIHSPYGESRHNVPGCWPLED